MPDLLPLRAARMAQIRLIEDLRFNGVTLPDHLTTVDGPHGISARAGRAVAECLPTVIGESDGCECTRCLAEYPPRALSR